MKTVQAFESDARDFVIDALTGAAGKPPSDEVVAVTVRELVRVFRPILHFDRPEPGETD